jgi:hypothetical protein
LYGISRSICGISSMLRSVYFSGVAIWEKGGIRGAIWVDPHSIAEGLGLWTSRH